MKNSDELFKDCTALYEEIREYCITGLIVQYNDPSKTSVRKILDGKSGLLDIKHRVEYMLQEIELGLQTLDEYKNAVEVPLVEEKK